jgi:hypothetical protein
MTRPSRQREPSEKSKEGQPYPMNECIICHNETASTVSGSIGDTTGALCDDCAFWCDGNILAEPVAA